MRITLLFCLLPLLTLTDCTTDSPTPAADQPEETLDLAAEKAAILATLNAETAAAFNRDYAAWQQHWVQRADIGKVYLDFAEDTFSESLGWAEISGFVRDFFERHPDPEPVPAPLGDIDVKLYGGEGAWVIYEQRDALRGRKRETRLMEKVNGEWKIAGMQTTIYAEANTED